MFSDIACIRTVEVIHRLGEQPISNEALAEKTRLSPRHQSDVVAFLAHLQVIEREGGQRGIPYRLRANIEVAKEYGYFDAA